MDKINKLILPATIIIASLILGGFFYANQVNKQRSIDQQQEIKLQEERRVEEAKAEQEQKEYVAKRKIDCYQLFEKQDDKWSNVEWSFYNEERDVCVITYKNSEYNETICERELKEYKEYYVNESDSRARSLIPQCSKYYENEY